MTTHEAAQVLRVSVRRVQSLITSGRLKAKKVGRDWWIEPADLEAVKQRKNGRPANQD